MIVQLAENKSIIFISEITLNVQIKPKMCSTQCTRNNSNQN